MSGIRDRKGRDGASLARGADAQGGVPSVAQAWQLCRACEMSDLLLDLVFPRPACISSPRPMPSSLTGHHASTLASHA